MRSRSAGVRDLESTLRRVSTRKDGCASESTGDVARAARESVGMAAQSTASMQKSIKGRRRPMLWQEHLEAGSARVQKNGL